MSVFSIENNLKQSKIKNDLKSKKHKNKKRIIFHIDVNNAYLSWSAVDMLKNGSEIDIRDEVSVIAGSNGGRNGMILAKSMKAKEIGIAAAMPMFEAFSKAPNLKIYPPDFDVYLKYSKEFVKILFKYTEKVMQTSIDECFLDMTEYLNNESPYDVANNIKKEIYNSLGFTVNIGIANCPVLAKTASDFKKPNMIHTLFDEEIKIKLWPLPVDKLFMVGKKTNTILKSLKIHYIKDLANTDKNYLEKHLGKNGAKLIDFANGIDELEITSEEAEIKSLSQAETFYNNIKDVDTLLAHLMKLVEKSCYRLRKKQLYAKVVALTFRYPDFKQYSKQRKVQPTNDTYTVYQESKKIFFEMYKGKALRLIGVRLDNLTDSLDEAKTIFELDLDNMIKNEKDLNNNNKNNSNNSKRKPKPQRNSLDSAIDSLNEMFGKEIISRARILAEKSETSKNKEVKFRFGMHKEICKNIKDEEKD